MSGPRGFLLDTNVISELVRDSPDAGVAAWIVRPPPESLCLSVITLGELVHGVARLAAGARRDRLEQWLRVDLPQQFAGRMLEFGEAQAIAWGQLKAATETQGRPRGAIDLQIAATAHLAELTLVTRNTRDFEDLELSFFNPWSA